MSNDTFNNKVRADIVLAGVSAFMLLDNAFGAVVAAAFTAYVVAIWSAVVLKVVDVDAQLLEKPDQLTWGMFAWNTFAALVQIVIFASAPHNQFWMGMLIGFYIIASVLISIRFVKLILVTE